MKSFRPPRPDDRAAILASTRRLKMAESAHAYVRGSTVRFYEWLEDATRVPVPQGPPVWICGDCHVGNVGPIASADGRIDIQIRDLDQTVIGNPAHDLIRLGLSLAMAARSSDLPGVTTAHILEQLTQGYQDALGQGPDAPPPDVPSIIRKSLREAAGRSWEHLADERIEGVEPTIPLGRRFWPLASHEREAIDALFDQESVRRMVASLRSRDNDSTVRVMDAAYWRKGCSSLGRLRFAVLLAIGGGKRGSRHCLIDVKEALKAAAPHDPDAHMPRDNGDRIVAGARALSPHLGGRILAAQLLDQAVFLRELLPQDLKLEIEHLTHPQSMAVARYLGGVLGEAHGRQLDSAARKDWLQTLAVRPADALEAPSWLWSSVVALVGTHEAAYLDHCRRYALETA